MSRFSENQVDEIRRSINIVHYISQYVQLKKAGVNYKGLCPFHQEKTPSFMVNPARQIYHCFGCHKGGNVYSFIQDYEKIDFGDALHRAADYAGVSLKEYRRDPEQESLFKKLYDLNRLAADFFKEKLAKSNTAGGYLSQRNLKPETVAAFELGYAPAGYESLLTELLRRGARPEEAAQLGLIQKRDEQQTYFDKFRHRLMFPFHHPSGNIIGFGGRKIDEEQQPKYLNSPESPVYQKGRILYGLHVAEEAIRSQGFAVLVEGYFDLLRLVDAEFKGAVASSGTAFTNAQAKLLSRYCREVFIAYDGDEAGQKAAIRSAQILEAEKMEATIVLFPDGHDPDSFVLKHGIRAFQKLLETQKNPFAFQIEKYLHDHPQPSIQEKEEFIREALGYIKSLSNPLKAGLYVQMLSEKLQIHESFLLEQLPGGKPQQWKSKAAPRRTEPESFKNIKVKSIEEQAEAGIIGLLTGGNAETRSLILEELHSEDFTGQLSGQIFRLVLDAIEETGRLDSGQILDYFQDEPEKQQQVAALFFQEFADEKRSVRDFIYQIKKKRLERRTAELQVQIAADADHTGSVTAHITELNEIRRMIGRLTKAYMASQKRYV